MSSATTTTNSAPATPAPTRTDDRAPPGAPRRLQRETSDNIDGIMPRILFPAFPEMSTTPATPAPLVRTYAMCANCSYGRPCSLYHPVPPPGAPRALRTNPQSLNNAENVRRNLFPREEDEVPTDTDE